MASSGSVTLPELAVLPSLTIQSWMPANLVVRVIQPNYYFNATVTNVKKTPTVPNVLSSVDDRLAAPFPDQRVDMAGVGATPTAPATATVSLAPQLFDLDTNGNPIAINVLVQPSTGPVAMQATYMTLEYEGAFYRVSATSNLLYTFEAQATGPGGATSAPPYIYGVMLPPTGASTGAVPPTPAILQILPALGATPALLLQNNTPFTLAVGGVSVPSGSQTNLTSSYSTAAVQAVGVPYPPGGPASQPPSGPASVPVTTAFAANTALASLNLASPLTYQPVIPNTQATAAGAFDVRVTANGTTGVVTAAVVWLGAPTGVLFYVNNSTPGPMVLTATAGTKVGAFAVVLSETQPSLVTGAYALGLTVGAFSSLAVSMVDAFGQGGGSSVNAYSVVCTTSGGSQAPLALAAPALGSTFPMAPGNTGAASSTTLTTGNLYVNWWPGTPNAVPFSFASPSAVSPLPTLRQAAAQMTLLISTSPLIVVQPSGTGLTTLNNTVVVAPSQAVPGFSPQLVAPVTNTYFPGGGSSNVPSGFAQAGSGPQAITAAAPTPLVNVDGGFVVKVVTGANGVPVVVQSSSPLDAGVGNRWQAASDFGAVTFFLPAYLGQATAPATPLSNDAVNATNVYTASVYTPVSGAQNYLFQVPIAGGVLFPLPVWVAFASAWRVVLNVSFAVPASSAGNGAQYLQNVCGGNGFTDCRPISGRPQATCLGYFDNTVGPLCQSIVLDSASGSPTDPTTNYVSAFTVLTENYCGGPGSRGPGWSTDACACLAVNGSGKLASPTRWALPGAGESSISFPDYVAKYNAQGFGSMPALMTNPLYAPCWWPPCTGATPALVPLASTRGGSAACTGTVTNCFGAVNSVITDKTSKTTEIVNNACSPTTPGGNANNSGKGVGLGGTRARAVTPNTIGDPPTTWKTPGAIAGITIGCVVVVVAVVLAVYYNKRGLVKK
jgi:hypothetical protein